MILKTRNGNINLVSPFDIHSYIVDVPPLKDDLIESAVRLRLRSLHPGDPENARIDVKQTSNNGSILAYTTDAENLENLKKQGFPLISGITILRAACEKSHTNIGVLITAEWVQLAVFHDGVPTLLTAFGNSISENATDRIEEYLKENSDAASLRTLVQVDCNAIDPANDKNFIITDFAPILDMIDLRNEMLFADSRKNKKRFHLICITLLILLNLFASITFLERIATHAETNAALVKTEYETQKKKMTRIIELQNEEKNLLETNKNSKAVYVDLFQFMQTLYENAHGAWIRSLILQGKSFTLEAEGADSLQVLSSLEKSDTFNHVRLLQASPSKTRGELFSISGELAQ